MIFLAAFLGELLLLFFLSRALTMHLSRFLYQLGIGEKLVMHFLAFLFLPGTFIHEVSHYLFSVILRVRVYGMSLLPKPAPGGYIKMGSVLHAECDLVRNLLIGSAPFLIGTLLLFFTLSFTQTNKLFFDHRGEITLILAGFIVFEIGNTMFSSRQDMEGAGKILLILGAILGGAYLLGWRISLEQLNQSIPGSLVAIIKQADLFLLVPIVLDVFIIGITAVLLKLFSRD